MTNTMAALHVAQYVAQHTLPFNFTADLNDTTAVRASVQSNTSVGSSQQAGRTFLALSTAGQPHGVKSHGSLEELRDLHLHVPSETRCGKLAPTAASVSMAPITWSSSHAQWLPNALTNQRDLFSSCRLRYAKHSERVGLECR